MCNALTVTKRKSAPLPERLCERITYSTAMFAIWVNFSDKFVQCEGADHRYYSTPEMQNILLQNVVGHVVRKAKNFADGATDTILSGRQVLINLMSDFVLDKTKATVESRQWKSYILERITNNATFAAGGQSVRFTPMTLGLTEGHYGECAGLLVGYSCSLALRRWRRLISPFAAVTKKPAVLSPGSLSCSISSITSCGILTVVICDFAFFAPVAISGSPKNWCMSVYAKKMIKKGLKCISPVSKLKSRGEIHPKEQRPAVLATHTGRLTTNDSESIEVAMRNHTTHPQGRDSHNLNKYIWRFIALSDEQPRVIHIEATSEQEARQQSPAGCVMVFAARIRQEVNHG
ncbi:host cell division inhibitor Icd-like protein [Escherichia coli]|nr:host cell division inhibitor Icd-like protein [Escherichia coli]EJT7522164.1 host cell division inhibitor Icd-like protein [Escherichia coli]